MYRNPQRGGLGPSRGPGRALETRKPDGTHRGPPLLAEFGWVREPAAESGTRAVRRQVRCGEAKRRRHVLVDDAGSPGLEGCGHGAARG